MYPIDHPTIASRIAKQRIDDRIRDAEARRLARATRRQARNVSDVRAVSGRAAVRDDRIHTTTIPTAQELPRTVASHPQGETP